MSIKLKLNKLFINLVRGQEKPTGVALNRRDYQELRLAYLDLGGTLPSDDLMYMGMPVFLTVGDGEPVFIFPWKYRGIVDTVNWHDHKIGEKPQDFPDWIGQPDESPDVA